MLALCQLRALALEAGAPDGVVAVALAAALMLLVLLVQAPAPGGPRSWRLGLGAGLGVGLLLLLPGAWLRLSGLPARGSFAPPGALAAWIPATLAIAGAEEALLRARLQPLLRDALGPQRAIVLTAAVFALMHLALYGPPALPLDLGVGLAIGVLRERTGSVAGCGLAHAVADIGFWWVA